jgi:hypothetical protein
MVPARDAGVAAMSDLAATTRKRLQQLKEAIGFTLAGLRTLQQAFDDSGISLSFFRWFRFFTPSFLTSTGVRVFADVEDRSTKVARKRLKTVH